MMMSPKLDAGDILLQESTPIGEHETAGDLIGTPVGQIVGMIDKVQPAKELILDMVNEYIDIVQQRADELASLE